VADPDDITAQSRRFAKDILDELDKPKSKGREEQMAQKERDDSEAVEQFYVATGQIKAVQIIARALVELADTLERLDPPDGDFEPIKVVFTLNERKAVLRFAPSPSESGKRYVELSLASKSGLSTSSQWLESGTNRHLVAYLRNPKAAADTLATSEELAQSVAIHGLA
jgi:hypothetical protein